mmetsp:Transcript_162384/g.299552  ORF Transcript_162384/g.299552 Transcript_162384/m.299552 type:complete len:280 (+) Transcript_162384:26-865(+)
MASLDTSRSQPSSSTFSILPPSRDSLSAAFASPYCSGVRHWKRIGTSVPLSHVRVSKLRGPVTKGTYPLAQIGLQRLSCSISSSSQVVSPALAIFALLGGWHFLTGAHSKEDGWKLPLKHTSSGTVGNKSVVSGTASCVSVVIRWHSGVQVSPLLKTTPSRHAGLAAFFTTRSVAIHTLLPGVPAGLPSVESPRSSSRSSSASSPVGFRSWLTPKRIWPLSAYPMLGTGLVVGELLASFFAFEWCAGTSPNFDSRELCLLPEPETVCAWCRRTRLDVLK